ncbi:hypothetical protein CC1G_03833 [Coprinopsis cinerea okayama7|uniref:Non-ribosomal peptide synthetase n=1 Tax=Coprinopsis cinerea (strain Okayama-7 / 130 / ATCC MYA-4618 / FGSC 9003) TaxID=240176 RepID=A8NGW5_COPC7|nr:hypothetical protein CC1G_03833 [Coprinopsis cinerea okayama7\|eukprot:XP_001833616.2 hypothetical protein CC1G_03833 [Coprinopsis cinerea okayama7\
MSDGLQRHPVPPADPEKGEMEHHIQMVEHAKALDTAITVVQSEKDGVVVTTKERVSAPPPPSSKPAPKPKRKVSKWVRWQLWFNMYRRFFVLSFGLNMIGLVLAATGRWPYAVKYNGAIVVANFNMAILMRNEVFGRLLYLFVNTCFAKWPPLWFRLGCTSVLQHLGGIHSGCALAGVAWLLFKVVRNFLLLDITHDSVLVMGVVTNIAVMVSALSAFPWVRNTHHNVFERHHRFVGWIGLVFTWAFVILGNTYDPYTRTWNLSGINLVRQQDFWFTMGMTVFVALPWFFVREVEVDVELPSSKVAILRFKRGMQQGLLGRISRSSIMEYHAFGIVSEGKHAKYHYMIAGVQGIYHAFTSLPRTFAGVSNTSTLYKRGIRVCTGTGIGAALSTCIQSPYWYLIWIGSDQEKTFGPTISGLIHKNIEPERLLLWDSKKRGGRPDTMKLIKEAYHSWGAEVVFITSNYIGNTEMMQGCKEAGIPCFGTLWDFVSAPRVSR